MAFLAWIRGHGDGDLLFLSYFFHSSFLAGVSALELVKTPSFRLSWRVCPSGHVLEASIYIFMSYTSLPS
jgi:hypothetical protein